MSMSDEELTNVARQAARANGCTCIPDITLLPTPINIEGLAVRQARVVHDDWCALMRRRQALVN